MNAKSHIHISFPELPSAAGQIYSTVKLYEQRVFTEAQMREYAQQAVKLNCALLLKPETQPCVDEGCPHYETGAICQPKEGGCTATVPQLLGEVVVTKHPNGRIVAVTRQDEEGHVLSVIAVAEEQHNSDCSIEAEKREMEATPPSPR